MKFTIDTLQKTITLHGSFQYDDFAAFRLTLPAEWREGYTFFVPFESIDAVLEQKQITQPPYPVTSYADDICCGGESTSCACRNEDC